MAPRPVAERHPEGLDLDREHVWANAIKTLKRLGAWSLDSAPLLKEYVFALMEADEAREARRDAQADRAVKRAMALADQLALTPRGRKAAGIGADDEEPARDQFAEVDELAPRREQRKSA